MSGNSNILICPKCKAENTPIGKAMTLAMTCKSCHVYFRSGSWNKNLTIFESTEKPALAIGSKGKFDNVVYQVMGFVVKKETRYHFKWREYLLFNPFEGYAFLSEYNGNWNILWPIEEDPKRGSVDSNFIYDGDKFDLFQKYRAEVVYGEGEFFFDVVDITESTVNYEYIGPPRMFSLEQSEDSVMWVEGEYISPEEIASAFNIPVNNLPKKQGRGYTQPIAAGFSEKSMIVFSVIIVFALLLIQFFFANNATNKIAYQGEFSDRDLKDNKVFVTPSFDLEGTYGNVVILMFSPIDNDYFFAEFSLINEGTGIEYNFSKEMEYYHGYEDGYSWSEGSTYGEAMLSKIPGGKYHINIYPETGAHGKSLSMTVKRNVAFSSNLFISLAILGLFPAGYYLRRRIIEGRRWSESDYSPYHSND